MNLTKVCKEWDDEQFATCVFVCGNPPSPRPPAWAKPTYVKETKFYTRPVLTFEQKQKWENWAIHCRETAVQHHWIENFFEWGEWLKDFLAWYDAALTIITTEQELGYDQEKQEK